MTSADPFSVGLGAGSEHRVGEIKQPVLIHRRHSQEEPEVCHYAPVVHNIKQENHLACGDKKLSIEGEDLGLLEGWSI